MEYIVYPVKRGISTTLASYPIRTDEETLPLIEMWVIYAVAYHLHGEPRENHAPKEGKTSAEGTDKISRRCLPMNYDLATYHEDP